MTVTLETNKSLPTKYRYNNRHKTKSIAKGYARSIASTDARAISQNTIRHEGTNVRIPK